MIDEHYPTAFLNECREILKKEFLRIAHRV